MKPFIEWPYFVTCTFINKLENLDIIKITTSKGNLSSLKIVGISEVGIAEIDDITSYTSLATAQKLLGEPTNYITDIQIKLYDMASAPAVAKEFHNKLNQGGRAFGRFLMWS